MVQASKYKHYTRHGSQGHENSNEGLDKRQSQSQQPHEGNSEQRDTQEVALGKREITQEDGCPEGTQSEEIGKDETG